MNQDNQSSYKSSVVSSGLLLPWGVGGGLGSVVGWLLTPIGFEKIGLGLGAVFGGIFVLCWQLYKTKGGAKYNNSLSLGPTGKIIYLVFIGLSLLFSIYVLSGWMDHPEKWLEALGALLFAVVGIVGLILFWKIDSHGGFNAQVDVRERKVLGWWTFAMSAVCLILVPLGNPFWGILGAIFCVCCGIIIIKKRSSS